MGPGSITPRRRAGADGGGIVRCRTDVPVCAAYNADNGLISMAGITPRGNES
jgi:hypothetical protein